MSIITLLVNRLSEKRAELDQQFDSDKPTSKEKNASDLGFMKGYNVAAKIVEDMDIVNKQIHPSLALKGNVLNAYMQLTAWKDATGGIKGYPTHRVYDDVVNKAAETLAAHIIDIETHISVLELYQHEYICKCGARVEPHKCSQGEQF